MQGEEKGKNRYEKKRKEKKGSEMELVIATDMVFYA